MKKSFAYLGASLAAIAALSSCNKELTNPDEGLKGGIPFEICASTADTKTVIDQAFKTTWVVGETPDSINVYHKLASDDAYTDDGKFLAETENGKFSGTLAAAPEAGEEYQWLAKYPYDSYLTTPAKGYSYIGSRSDETQSQKGLNSTAHLSGYYMPLVGKGTSTGTASPTIKMVHASSVIEINVTNNTTEALDVTSIAFTAPESIIGQFVIDYTGETTTYTEKKYASATATLSVTDGTIAAGKSGKFYIAIKPFSAASGKTLKVSVNGYSKDIPLTKDVTFTAGKIKKVNFDFDKVQTTYTWDLSVDSTTEATAEKLAWTNDVADMVCEKGKSTTATNNYYPGTSNYSSTRFYSKSTLSITPKAGKSLTYYVFYATSENYANALANSTWTNATANVDGTTVIVIADNPSVAVSAVIGATCGFTKVECHTDAVPVYAPIITANPTSIEAPAAGDDCTILYSIKFPVDGKSISATSDQSWVNTFDYSTTGEISFVVAPNFGDARTATVTLSYEGAENVVVSISQNAVGSVSEKEIEIVGKFTSVTNGLSLTYQGITITQLKGTSSTSPNTSYATATTLRVYVGNTLTFSSDKTITKIVLSHTSSNNGGSDTTADVGTYARGTTSSTWTGSANEVTITNAKGSSDTNNIQIRPTKIVVTVLE